MSSCHIYYVLSWLSTLLGCLRVAGVRLFIQSITFLNYRAHCFMLYIICYLYVLCFIFTGFAPHLVMYMLDISLDLEALGLVYPEVDMTESIQIMSSCSEGGREVSTLFSAISSEESSWIEAASVNNSPF
jgi:hypothetical protein